MYILYKLSVMRFTKKRNIASIALVALLSSILLSCERKEDSPAPSIHSYKMRFEDKAGNDKVHGIPYLPDKKAERNIFDIQKNEYKLDIIQEKKKWNLYLGPLSVQLTDLYDCLIITTTNFSFPNYQPNQLTHKLVCPYVFGDENEHTIISNWEKAGPIYFICKSLVVDGKSYLPSNTEEDDKMTFTIVINN